MGATDASAKATAPTGTADRATSAQTAYATGTARAAKTAQATQTLNAAAAELERDHMEHEYITRREFEAHQTMMQQAMAVTQQALAKVDRQLETGAGTFQSIQIVQQRHSSFIDTLQKGQERLERDQKDSANTGGPLMARLAAMEVKLSAIEKLPGELHALRDTLNAMTIKAEERERHAEEEEDKFHDSRRRTDSWAQFLLRMVLFPLACAAFGYVYNGWSDMHQYIENQEQKQTAPHGAVKHDTTP